MNMVSEPVDMIELRAPREKPPAKDKVENLRTRIASSQTGVGVAVAHPHSIQRVKSSIGWMFIAIVCYARRNSRRTIMENCCLVRSIQDMTYLGWTRKLVR